MKEKKIQRRLKYLPLYPNNECLDRTGPNYRLFYKSKSNIYENKPVFILKYNVEKISKNNMNDFWKDVLIILRKLRNFTKNDESLNIKILKVKRIEKINANQVNIVVICKVMVKTRIKKKYEIFLKERWDKEYRKHLSDEEIYHTKSQFRLIHCILKINTYMLYNMPENLNHRDITIKLLADELKHSFYEEKNLKNCQNVYQESIKNNLKISFLQSDNVIDNFMNPKKTKKSDENPNQLELYKKQPIKIMKNKERIYKTTLGILKFYIIIILTAQILPSLSATQSAAANNADFNVTRGHDDHAGNNHSDVRSNAVHGVYPGEGHEAEHGSGINFHAHEQQYGPAHELHGEFNDGHTRMEHQLMYHKGGPGHNGAHSGMGSGQLHDHAMWDTHGHGHGSGVWNDGFGGEDHGGHSVDGWLYGEGQGAAMGGVHGDGYFFGHGGVAGVGDLGHGHGGHGHDEHGGIGHGAGDLLHGEEAAHGRDMFGHGYGGLYGGGLEHNHALGGHGLLSATGDEIAFGGAMHGLASGFGRAGLAGDAGLAANVMNFYEDEGLIDPVTGTFRGGHAHAQTFGHHARQHAKGMEIARNMANGNVFRHAVAVEGDEGALADASFGHQHSHYGQSGILPTMAHRHSAMLGAVEGISTAFDGLTPLERHAATMAQHIALEKKALNGNIEAMQHIINFENMSQENKASLMDKQSQAFARHAQLDAMVGNYGSAQEKMKKSVLAHLEASQQRVDEAANWHMQAARDAMLHGDMISAASFEAAGQCMAAKGKQTAAAYASSVGALSHHFDQTSFIGSEEHANRARAKALEAEKMRTKAVMIGDVELTNAVNALAAVENAVGRTEGEFGAKLDKISANKQVQAQMVNMEEVNKSGIKEAIATQDNMNMISTGNTALNKTVADTIEDMALKSESGAHQRAAAEAGNVLADVSAQNMLNAMVVNDIITNQLKPPEIKEAIYIANEEEIAADLIKKEAQKIKLEILENEKKKQLENMKEKGSDTLGIIETIPEDAERLDIENSLLKFPLKSYEPKVAKSMVEKEALEAQNRLRDDLRGKVTENKFDSPLNVIKTDKGYFNIPESAESIEIKEGIAYFNENAKSKMIKNGLDVTNLSHKINTGERKDMAAGMGYYIADMAGMTLDLPSPSQSHPPSIAYNNSKIIELSEAEGIDIASGSIKLVPWSEYLRRLRPKVNLAIINEYPSKETIRKTKKINKVKEHAEKILQKDIRLVEEISNVKKKIIVNPDGKTYVELRPAYGVAEQIRLDETNKTIPSTFVKKRSEIKFGQNGIEEITGESEIKRNVSGGKVSKVGLEMNIVIDPETRFLVNTRNAFSGIVVPEKEELAKEVAIPVFGGMDWQKIVDGSTQESLLKISKEGETAFEKKKEIDTIKHKIILRKDIKKEYHYEEGMNINHQWEFEIRIERLRRSSGSIKIMSDHDLIRIIERYIHASFSTMREFKYELHYPTYIQNQHEFLRRFRQNRIEWLEWINRIKKELKMKLRNHVVSENKRIKNTSDKDDVPSNNEIGDMIDKITDEVFNMLRDYFILSFRAPDDIKILVSTQRDKAEAEIRNIFGKMTHIVIDMINEALIKIENSSSTLGGTVHGNTLRIYLPVKHTAESRTPMKNGKIMRKETTVSIMRPYDVNLNTKVILKDGVGYKPKEVIFGDLPIATEVGKKKEGDIIVSSDVRTNVIDQNDKENKNNNVFTTVESHILSDKNGGLTIGRSENNCITAPNPLDPTRGDVLIGTKNNCIVNYSTKQQDNKNECIPPSLPQPQIQPNPQIIYQQKTYEVSQPVQVYTQNLVPIRKIEKPNKIVMPLRIKKVPPKPPVKKEECLCSPNPIGLKIPTGAFKSK